MALLMPEGERANWEGLSQGISDYYNSPGRLVVFRRQFESATRRTGMDPAMFASELEILAVRGFGDMSNCARNQMVRDRFIAAQRSCGLRGHLDSVPPDTPIRDIVDRCHVWESHSEQKKGSAPGAGLDQELPGMSGDSREPGFFRPNSLKPVGCPEVDSRIPVPVANVIQSDIVAPRKGGGGGRQVQSGCPSRNHVLPDCTTVTGRSGGSSGGGEGASGCWSKTIISCQRWSR